MLSKLKVITLEYWMIWIAVAVCLAATLWILGCEPETSSILDLNQKVNRTELISEFEFLMARYKNSISDLDKQQQIRDLILQQTLVVAQSGTINPVGLITALSGIMGIGFAADDIRLRKERKKAIRYEPITENK